MNKYIRNITFVSALSLWAMSTTSCTDYLDKAPASDINPTDAYTNFRSFQGFTEELYNCVPVITGNTSHNSWNWGEDVYWIPNDTRPFAYRIDQGDYWAWNSCEYGWLKDGGKPETGTRGDKGRLWGLSWYGIRKANIGIANLDKLTDATQEEKNLIEGQLYLFRGWFHFMLMQFWGGLPYIDEVIASDAEFRMGRLNYQQTADKAAADFRHAASLLPVDWDKTTAGKLTLGNNNQRINKIMALGYLGKNLLYAGSPLMNQESTGNATYNKEYCRQAAEAFAEALKLCDETGRYELASFDEYESLFYTHKQNNKINGLKEAIFQENLVEVSSRFRWNQIMDYRPKCLITSGIKVYPTANYVDYFGMKNGLPLDDIDSGFDKTYPWKDRDPRFYKDIVVDGTKCALNTKGNLAEDVQYASLYTGGTYRTYKDPEGIRSGYMMTKFCPLLINDWDGYLSGNIMVLSLMRLADVYLMYAEAVAMANDDIYAKVAGYDLTALEAVNKIRQRAGVDPIADKYLVNVDLFMGELQRERAVELAFEGHRFNDLRRWMLFLQYPYNVKLAVEFDRDMSVSDEDRYADPINNGKVQNWRYSTLIERKLSQKHYWLPFKRDDVNIYPEFKQNPGW